MTIKTFKYRNPFPPQSDKWIAREEQIKRNINRHIAIQAGADEIIDTKIVKHKIEFKWKQMGVSELQGYQFYATLTFASGSVKTKAITEVRKAYEHLDTIDLIDSEIKELKDESIAEYLKVRELVSREDYYYSRPTKYGCSIYRKDSTSPTGRERVGSCSSYKVVEKLNSRVVSPTEKIEY